MWPANYRFLTASDNNGLPRNLPCSIYFNLYDERGGSGCGGRRLMVHVTSQRVGVSANSINEQIAMSSHVSDIADLIS